MGDMHNLKSCHESCSLAQNISHWMAATIGGMPLVQWRVGTISWPESRQAGFTRC